MIIDTQALLRSGVLSLAMIALASCSGAKLAVSRDYIPRYETMPRSIHMSEEQYASSITEFSTWTSAGHVIFLSNEGDKIFTLTDVSVNFQGVEETLPLTASVQVPSRGTVSIPLLIVEGTQAACLIPTLLEGYIQIGEQSRRKPFTLAFAEGMDAAHFREWRLAGCVQSPPET